MGSFDWGIFFVLVLLALSVVLFAFSQVKDYRTRWVILSCVASVFLYSGVGVAYTSVSNKYVFSFGLFIFSFCLPFCFFKNAGRNNKQSILDAYLFNNYRLLEKVAVLYLLTLLVPCVYPEFRLFQPFTVRDNYWGTIETLRSDPVNVVASTLSLLIKPFFFAYLVCYAIKNPGGKKHLLFFGLAVLLSFLKLHYIARNTIITDLTEFLILYFCLKGDRVVIKRKHILVFVSLIVALIPFLYVYKLLVTGKDIDSSSLSFGDTASMLMEQELTYPRFYDMILASNHYNHLTVWKFLAYVICLPIPSFLWPGKPSIGFADAFTYGTIGLRRGDIGFYILLPSAMGESFMVGGYDYSWAFALITGFAVALITRYICRHKTLIFFLFYLIVETATYGRGGTSGLLPVYITGMLGVFILDIILRIKAVN